MKTNDKRLFFLAIVFSVLAHITILILFLPVYALIKFIKWLFFEENEELRVALVAAILLHLASIPLMLYLLEYEDSEYEDEDYSVLMLWDEEEEELTPEEELKQYEPEEEIPNGQVVESKPSKDKRRPDDPRFLSEQDSRVEKETRATVRLPGTEKVIGTPNVPSTGQASQTLEGGIVSQKNGAKEESEVFPEAPEALLKESDSAPKANKVISLDPSMEAMQTVLSGTGLDHLEDVIDGDHTAVNTAGWKYASFFNRVKKKVERYWHPSREYRKHDPYGNIYGFKDRQTTLLVVLHSDGSLKKVYVMNPSGAGFLDDEAVKAVELAAPFPNVPAGLKDRESGLVKFTFHFLVQVGEQPIFRMRRYQP